MAGLTLPVIAAVVAAAMVAALLRWRTRLPHAAPNARSLHEAPMPRVGGLAIWAGFIPIAVAAPADPGLAMATWIGPWALLVAVSLLDDVRGVPVGPRLAVHALAAAWFAYALVASGGSAGGLSAGLVAVATVALIVAWSLNLYNFMDGSDGLAAAMTIVGFGAFAAALLCSGLPATLPLALAAATVPLFAVNRPPARIFLGDVGAVPLGFLAAAFGVGGVASGLWPSWFPVLVFLPFIADATITLARRALRGERFWEPHRTHYYQRLNRLGAGHRGTLAVFGALMLGTAGTAVALLCLAPAWGVPALVAWCAVCAVLFAAIDYHWRRKQVPTP